MRSSVDVVPIGNATGASPPNPGNAPGSTMRSSDAKYVCSVLTLESGECARAYARTHKARMAAGDLRVPSATLSTNVSSGRRAARARRPRAAAGLRGARRRGELVTTFSIVAAAVAGNQDAGVVFTLGVANLLADGLSMAAGDLLSQRAERERARSSASAGSWRTTPRARRQSCASSTRGWACARTTPRRSDEPIPVTHSIPTEPNT